jgi:peptidoglycan glycosyltransferase
MNGPIRRLAAALFTGFAILLFAVTWFQVVRADELKTDPRNPRPALADRGKERGLIVSADRTVLARSVPDPDDPRSFVREYPEGPAFAHAVGYSSFLVGASGLEAEYSSELRSRRDLTISDLVAVILGQDLRPKTVEVTLDAALQRLAFDALGEHRGAVVAMDPRTGAVLASVSKPSFDPSVLNALDGAEQWDNLLADPNRPLLDRATRERYPPGSTFKTVVAAAGLDTGKATPATEFSDPAEFRLPNSTATISNFDGGPCNNGETTTLLQAFVRSCNTIFADLAIQLGASDIGITAEALGFNRDIEFEWTVAEAVFPVGELEDDPAALGQSGIGERDVRATPLHMAMVAAAVANEGMVPSPFLMQRVVDATGATVAGTEPAAMQAMSAETASVLSQMMERVVTEGTGRRAAVPGVRVAGKTGTATGQGGFPNTWFIGFAPVADPQIAVAVFVEGTPASGETASGSATAAPIAALLIENWVGRQS